MGQSSGKPCARCKSALGWQSLMILQSHAEQFRTAAVLCSSGLGLPGHGMRVELALKSLISKPCHIPDTPMRTEQGLSQKESFLPLMFWSRRLMKHKCLQGLHELMFSRASLLQCGFS